MAIRSEAEQVDRHEALHAALQSSARGHCRKDATLRVLPQRTLLRGLTWKVPSGPSIARHIGAPPLVKADFRELQPLQLDESTPLFYYVLKEAELVQSRAFPRSRRGPVVGEVIIGLLHEIPTRTCP